MIRSVVDSPVPIQSKPLRPSSTSERRHQKQALQDTTVRTQEAKGKPSNPRPPSLPSPPRSSLLPHAPQEHPSNRGTVQDSTPHRKLGERRLPLWSRKDPHFPTTSTSPHFATPTLHRTRTAPTPTSASGGERKERGEEDVGDEGKGSGGAGSIRCARWAGKGACDEEQRSKGWEECDAGSANRKEKRRAGGAGAIRRARWNRSDEVKREEEGVGVEWGRRSGKWEEAKTREEKDVESGGGGGRNREEEDRGRRGQPARRKLERNESTKEDRADLKHELASRRSREDVREEAAEHGARAREGADERAGDARRLRTKPLVLPPRLESQICEQEGRRQGNGSDGSVQFRCDARRAKERQRRDKTKEKDSHHWQVRFRKPNRDAISFSSFSLILGVSNSTGTQLGVNLEGLHDIWGRKSAWMRRRGMKRSKTYQRSRSLELVDARLRLGLCEGDEYEILRGPPPTALRTRCTRDQRCRLCCVLVERSCIRRMTFPTPKDPAQRWGCAVAWSTAGAARQMPRHRPTRGLRHLVLVSRGGTPPDGGNPYRRLLGVGGAVERKLGVALGGRRLKLQRGDIFIPRGCADSFHSSRGSWRLRHVFDARAATESASASKRVGRRNVIRKGWRWRARIERSQGGQYEGCVGCEARERKERPWREGMKTKSSIHTLYVSSTLRLPPRRILPRNLVHAGALRLGREFIAFDRMKLSEARGASTTLAARAWLSGGRNGGHS
ncbi:hypothetical protein DFH09DRAFT_1270659 [Mycena vulgaris]|nr:hypothetical protein DFH09DRAFT_1270659 [Mycena vulgaris]